MVYHLSIQQCNASLYDELLCLREQGDIRSSRLQSKWLCYIGVSVTAAVDVLRWEN